MNGGVLTAAASVAVIEDGGVVVQSDKPPIQFVKRGGTLLEFRSAHGIVFYETAAKLGPGVVRPNQPAPCTLVRVPEITACPGVGPFRYVAPLLPDLETAPQAPPSIRGFSPRAARPDGIVTLVGNGFARTTAVLFVGQSGGVRTGGFRVLSDRELRVEVPDPDGAAGPQIPAVVTTLGMAVAVPVHQTLRAGLPVFTRNMAAAARTALLWVGSGDIIGAVPNQSIFIAPGGLSTRAEANRVYFVQHGGKLGDSAAAPASVFFEPDANIPDRLKLRSNRAACSRHRTQRGGLSVFHLAIGRAAEPC